MGRHGKNYVNKSSLVGEDKAFGLDEAIKLIGDIHSAKFDETVDIALRLGVDPKHSDQLVRGAVNLPHGTGRTVRVIVFAKGEKSTEAENAGADLVGADDLIEKIQGGWMEFDAAIATPDMMGSVSKIGKVLGPRGLMPNPKLGTVTFEVEKAVKEVKAGKVEFRVDKAGIVHAPIGKVSFGDDKLKGNLMSVLETIYRVKPSGAKGKYFRSLYLSTTMSPSIKIIHSDLEMFA